jgi:hypothetical protein
MILTEGVRLAHVEMPDTTEYPERYASRFAFVRHFATTAAKKCLINIHSGVMTQHRHPDKFLSIRSTSVLTEGAVLKPPLQAVDCILRRDRSIPCRRHRLERIKVALDDTQDAVERYAFSSKSRFMEVSRLARLDARE